jgi:hypothetical protein
MIESPVIFGFVTSSIICFIIYLVLREKNKYNEDKYNESKQDIIGLFFIIFFTIFITHIIYNKTSSTNIVPIEVNDGNCPF